MQQRAERQEAAEDGDDRRRPQPISGPVLASVERELVEGGFGMSPFAHDGVDAPSLPITVSGLAGEWRSARVRGLSGHADLDRSEADGQRDTDQEDAKGEDAGSLARSFAASTRP